jgi:transcriptional regulator with GAF, ATPase, and Fis domain
LRRRFLMEMLELQNVERGSIWVKSGNGYVCVEAAGAQSEAVKGITISVDAPSIVGWVIENGKMTIAEPGKDARHLKGFEDRLAVKSTLILCFPLLLKSGAVYGAIQIIDTSTGGNRLNLTKEYLELLQELVDVGSIALSNSLVYTDQVEENLKLKQVLETIRKEEVIIGRNEEFRRIMKLAGDYALTDFPVLITGESGTGKEIVAREIHRLSRRRARPFLVQNCSAIPDTLLESELFGYKKGAFTGAVTDRVGLFEAAHEGTIFLDEIGDMPIQLQARILRVLQNNEIKPLGGTKTCKIDVRIISATNKDLKEGIAGSQFREDLFYRLDVLPLHVPPLRERQQDIPLLLEHFTRREALRMGIRAKTFSKDALAYLCAYPWRGNIRELENFVKPLMVVPPGDRVALKDLPVHFTAGLDHAVENDHPVAVSPGTSGLQAESPRCDGALQLADYTWDELERAYVMALLEKHRWHVTRAAKQAGLTRSTFNSRMRRLGIRR